MGWKPRPHEEVGDEDRGSRRKESGTQRRPVDVAHESTYAGHDVSGWSANLLGAQVGNYHLISEIGRGGMGTVYRAEHVTLGGAVAVKILSAEVAESREAVDRFLAEARASTALEHPAFPRYHDFGRLPDGGVYAVLDLLVGETMEDRIRSRGPLDLPWCREILVAACGALEYAHGRGIVHRDIKPANLFLVVDESGESLRILDLGIAKIATSTPSLTQAHMFLGTPAYCAPEQAFGAAVGPSADVYALAATAFEMLTGSEPILADELSELLERKVSSPPPSVRARRPELPAEVDVTLRRALDPVATRRFASMSELEASIREWGAVAGSRKGITMTRRRLAGVAALVTALGVAVGAALAVWTPANVEPGSVDRLDGSQAATEPWVGPVAGPPPHDLDDLPSGLEAPTERADPSPPREVDVPAAQVRARPLREARAKTRRTVRSPEPSTSGVVVPSEAVPTRTDARDDPNAAPIHSHHAPRAIFVDPFSE